MTTVIGKQLPHAFLAKVDYPERAKLVRVLGDLAVATCSRELFERASSESLSSDTQSMLGNQVSDAWLRVSGEGPFLMSLLYRLGDDGIEAVLASGVLDPEAVTKFRTLSSGFSGHVAAFERGLSSRPDPKAARGDAAILRDPTGCALGLSAAAAGLTGATLSGGSGPILFLSGAAFGAGVVLAFEFC